MRDPQRQQIEFRYPDQDSVLPVLRAQIATEREQMLSHLPVTLPISRVELFDELLESMHRQL